MRWGHRAERAPRCVMCGERALARHCPPRNECGWLACTACGARCDAYRGRWIPATLWIDDPSFSAEPSAEWRQR